MGVSVAVIDPDEKPGHKLNATRIKNIIMYERNAEEALAELEAIGREKFSYADENRSKAAGLIVRELESGSTTRQVAEAIGKSPSHVQFAAVAFKLLNAEGSKIETFNDAYRVAKQPEPVREAAVRGETAPAVTEGAGASKDSGEKPFPAWSKQKAALTALVEEMIEQCTLPQAIWLGKYLTRSAETVIAKEEELKENASHLPAVA